MSNCDRCHDTGWVFGPMNATGRNEWRKPCTCPKGKEVEAK